MTADRRAGNHLNAHNAAQTMQKAIPKVRTQRPITTIRQQANHTHGFVGTGDEKVSSSKPSRFFPQQITPSTDKTCVLANGPLASLLHLHCNCLLQTAWLESMLKEEMQCGGNDANHNAMFAYTANTIFQQSHHIHGFVSTGDTNNHWDRYLNTMCLSVHYRSQENANRVDISH